MNYLLKNKWGVALSLLVIFVFVTTYFNRAEAVNSVNFFWRAEGTTLDGTHDFSAGDTTARLNLNAAINSDAVKIGTNGLDALDNDAYAEFAISSNDLVSNAEGSIGLWVRFINWTSASHFTFLIQQSATPANNIALYNAGTDDATGREFTFRIRRSGVSTVTLTTTDADLQENAWYFVVVRWDEPNSDRRIEVYNENGSLRTSIEDLTTNFDQPQGLDQLRIGDSIGTGTFDQHIDNFFTADDYSEPLENKMNITSWTEYESSATIPITVKGGVSIKGGVQFR